MCERRSSVAAVLGALALIGCSPAGRPPATPQPTTESAAEKAGPLPASSEIRTQVCALAPDSASGLRMLQAVRWLGRPDTLAIVGAARVPLSNAVGPVRVAGDAPWFAARRTLDLMVGGRLQRYAIYDVGRIIQPGDLAYLGTVDGLPVYAAAAEVAPVQPAQVRAAAGTRELDPLIAADAALRARMRAIEVLYVPLRATGCVFQPLLRTAP